MGNPYQSGVGQYGQQAPQAHSTLGSHGTGGPHEPNSLGQAPHSNRYQAAAPQQAVSQSYAPPQPQAAPAQVAQTQAIDQGNNGNEQEDAARANRSASAQGRGHEIGTTSPQDGILNALSAVSGIPGLSSLSSIGSNIVGDDYTPTTYGNEGTIGTEGGVFDERGREFDTTTGQALNSYGSKSDFLNSNYVQGIQNDPFSVGSYLSDGDNTREAIAQRGRDYRGEEDTTDSFLGQNRQGGFSDARTRDQASGSFRDALAFQGDALSLDPGKQDRTAQQIGQNEYGFQGHTVAPGSATNLAIQGLGADQAHQGSQYSQDGTFSTESDNNGVDNQISNAGGSFAGDDPSTYEEPDNSGGGGGGGK